MSKFTLFTGVGTALITPFAPDGSVDLAAFGRLVRRQLDAGVSALITGATTGEGPTLTDEEKTELVRAARSACGGAVPVIAGAGSNDTAHARRLAAACEKAGADGLLAVTPYYNKTTPEGLYAYYADLCGAVSLPVIAYTVPARTGMGIPLSVCGALFALPNLVGIKDAAGDLSYTARLTSCWSEQTCVYSGSDDTALAAYALGADGVISVAANVAPEMCVSLFDLYLRGKARQASDLNARLQPLNDALFSEVSPIPVKAAAELAGLCSGRVRPPLVPASDRTVGLLRAALDGLDALPRRKDAEI